MENINIDQHMISQIGSTTEEMRCWICFYSNKDDFEDDREWVSPCKCIGSTKWAHQMCVQRWIDEQLKHNVFAKPCCPQCKTKYIIVMKEVNYFVRVLNILDTASNQICPIIVCSGIISTVYLLAATYGIFTVLQVLGEEEGTLMMDNTNQYILLLILPTIPMILFIGKSINWEDTFLLLVQRFTAKLPLLKNIMPAFLIEPVNITNNTWQLSPFVNSSIIFSSALLLPTFATIVGNFLFKNKSYTNLQRTLFGGLIYIAVKGALRIYQKQHNVISQRSKIILNYTDSDNEENNQ